MTGTWSGATRSPPADELPHRIDHVATVRALADSGCDRVLALSSVGGLRADLGPGTLLVPDDFIALDAEPLSALEGPEAHRVPGFDPEWRAALVAALDGRGRSRRSARASTGRRGVRASRRPPRSG